MSPARVVAALALQVLLAPESAQGDLVHHRLNVRLSPNDSLLRVEDVVRIPASQSALSFELDPRLSIDEVRIAGELVRFRLDDGRWIADRTSGVAAEVTVTYSGRLPLGSAPKQASYIGSDGTMLVGDWVPRFGNDPVHYQLDVRISDGHTAVAPGRSSGEQRDTGEYRCRFASERPSDGVALFGGPFEIHEAKHGATVLRTYFPLEVDGHAGVYLEKSAEYLRRYETTIGRYPFSHFYVVASPMPVGFGFPGIAYLSRRIIPLPYVPATSLGHEVLHNWWGNGVRTDGNSGNWAEGLTTFMADYAYAEDSNPTKARDMRLRWLREYAVLPEDRDFRIADFRGRGHTASQVVGYHKTAYVFLMLRDRIGTPSFEEALRDFWEHREGSTATWSDLRQAFEARSGRSLSRFFEQWVDRKGAPDLKLRASNSRRVEGGYSVMVELRQSEPPYELPVPIEIRTDSGAVRHVVPLDTTLSRRTFEVDAAPLSVRADPELRLFRRLGSEEVPPILREVAFTRMPATLVLSDDEDMRAAANELAAAFFEQDPKWVSEAEAGLSKATLVIGNATEIERYAAATAIDSTVAELVDGSAKVWAVRRPAGGAIVFAAGSPTALRRITRPLPHYGSQSYVVFEGAKAVSRGLWQPTSSGPLVVDFEATQARKRAPSPK